MPTDNLSFGPFQFDPQAGHLSKHGHRIKLPPKSAAILSCLLEHRGEVVSRQQLREVLWPVGTYVDFDLGIKVSVKKLRDALGDVSEAPTYVQTIYGEGYRFIASVGSTGAVTQSEPPLAAVACSQEAAVPLPQTPPVSTTRQKILWKGAVAAAVAMAALRLLTWPPHSNALNFQSRDWVVIAAFDNRTGEKLLDGSLEFAVERELSRSSYLNVAPPDRIGDALKLMRLNRETVLTEDLARQVAVRDGGIKAVLAGRIEKFGPKYVLTVRVVKPVNGETVAVFERDGNLGRLPAAAQSLAADLRRTLGEPSPKPGSVPPQLEKATTPSLAALAAFSAGVRNAHEGKAPLAAELFEEALKEDPQFAMAHIYVARCLDDPDQAAAHYRAAFQLAGGVSDRERLFILGTYYELFLNDDGRALAAYEALVNLYPDDYWGVDRLMWMYRKLGKSKEEIEILERLTTVRPATASGFMQDLWWYYRREHPDRTKAKEYGDQLRRMRRDSKLEALQQSQINASLDLEAAADQWLKGDVDDAAQGVARVSTLALAQSDDYYTMILSSANLVLGRIRAARELCGHVGDPDVSRACLLRVAYVSADTASAREQLSGLQVSPRTAPLELIAIGAALWLGDIATAKRWWGADYNTNGFFLLAQGHPREAIELFRRETIPLDYQGSRYLVAVEVAGTRHSPGTARTGQRSHHGIAERYEPCDRRFSEGLGVAGLPRETGWVVPESWPPGRCLKGGGRDPALPLGR